MAISICPSTSRSAKVRIGAVAGGFIGSPVSSQNRAPCTGHAIQPCRIRPHSSFSSAWLQRFGRAGVPFDPRVLAVWLGPHQLMAAGEPLPFDRPAASAYLRERAAGAYLRDDTVLIRLVVGEGRGEGRAWGCDLSDQYVRINADYTT